jgi:hypothetical protein
MRARRETAVLLCLLGAGCGGGDGGGESARPQQAGSKAPAAGPAFGDYQDLDSGRTYTTTVFKPAVRFTVPAGRWSSEEGDTAADFAVAVKGPRGGVAQAILALHRVSLVYDPRRGGTIPGDRVALRGSFANWLRRHPRLRIRADRPTRLMGLEGSLIEVSGKSQPPRVPNECPKSGPDCAPLFYAGLDPVVYPRTARGRFIVLTLPGGGELVVEEFVEPSRAFAHGLRQLSPLLAQLRLAAG